MSRCERITACLSYLYSRGSVCSVNTGFGSIDLTSLSVRLLRFQLFFAENKMNSWSDSTGDTPHKTESNSTCIQVKQVPIFPHG